MTEEIQAALTKLAAATAQRLLTNGQNERARRLVLELPDGRDAGGRNEASVRNEIIAELTERIGPVIEAARRVIANPAWAGVCDEDVELERAVKAFLAEGINQ